MKARQTIAAVLLAVAVVPLGIASWMDQAARSETIARERDAALARRASETARELEGLARGWLESARGDARLPGVGGAAGDGGATEGRGERVVAAISDRDPVNINSVAILDARGRNIVDSRAVLAGGDESAEPYVIEVLRDGLPRLVGPYLPAWDDRPAIIVAAPVRDAANAIQGLLRLRIEPAALSFVIDANLPAGAGRIGLRLVGQDGARIDGLNDEPLGEARFGLASPGVAPLAEVAGMRGSVVAVPSTGWRVVAFEPEADWQAAVRAPLRAWVGDMLLVTALSLVAAWLLGGRLVRPLVQAAEAAEAVAGGELGRRMGTSASREARRLSSAFNSMADRLTRNLGELEASRRELATLVHQIPGAVYRCRLDQNWTMLFISERIEELTGYPPAAFIGNRDITMAALQMPEDAQRLADEVEAALREDRPFEMRYRLRRRDGAMRWIWERGQAHRGPGGDVEFLEGVMIDITANHRGEQTLAALRRGTEGLVGEPFFRALTSSLASLAGVRYAGVSRLDLDGPGLETTLAFCADGELRENRSFPVAGSPSIALLEDGQLLIRDGVRVQFPRDAALAGIQARGYAGQLLRGADGRPIGLIALVHDAPLPEDALDPALLGLFAQRAAAEIARMDAETRLQALAADLEHRVEARTRELAASTTQLTQAMGQLVQSEKLASLGSLVAGVAHELNTPIGNALTVSSTLREMQQNLAAELAGGGLKRSTLERYTAETGEAVELIGRNLARAADLIGHFKQAAVDQTSTRRRRFELRQVAEEVLVTLSPRLKRTPFKVELDIPHGITLDSYPGPLEQVLTNLISNSLDHAFEGRDSGRIRIVAVQAGERVGLVYEDDGCGIPLALRHRVFDPFFTTRLGRGGSGLGLYITYGLVTGRLGGHLAIDDAPGGGARFEIDLPLRAPDSGHDDA